MLGNTGLRLLTHIPNKYGVEHLETPTTGLLSSSIPRYCPSLSMTAPSTPSDLDVSTTVALTNMSQHVNDALKEVGQSFDYEWSYLKESTIDLTVQTMCFGTFACTSCECTNVLKSITTTRAVHCACGRCSVCSSVSFPLITDGTSGAQS